MMIHDITNMAGKYKARKRVGRGHGSGSGKTSGRGHKGAGSRAGHTHRPGFEGGQTPWARRLPKRGFSNASFRTEYHVVNVGQLEARFNDGDEVNLDEAAPPETTRSDITLTTWTSKSRRGSRRRRHDAWMSHLDLHRLRIDS